MKKRKPLVQNLSFRVYYDGDHFLLHPPLNAKYQNYPFGSKRGERNEIENKKSKNPKMNPFSIKSLVK